MTYEYCHVDEAMASLARVNGFLSLGFERDGELSCPCPKCWGEFKNSPGFQSGEVGVCVVTEMSCHAMPTVCVEMLLYRRKSAPAQEVAS